MVVANNVVSIISLGVCAPISSRILSIVNGIICIEDNLLDETSKKTKRLLLKTLNKKEEEEDRKRYGC